MRNPLAASILMLVAFSSSACVVLLRPRGEWAHPVDLRLTDKSLAGQKIHVMCVDQFGEDEPPMPADHKLCSMIEKNLEVLGASIIHPLDPAQAAARPSPLANAAPQMEQSPVERADFTVVYTGKESNVDHCFWPDLWALPLFVISFTLYPCIVDTTTEAELAILDKNGAVRDRKKLALISHRVHGLWALPFLLQDWTDIDSPHNRHGRQLELREGLAHYVQNTAVSYVIRTHGIAGIPSSEIDAMFDDDGGGT